MFFINPIFVFYHQKCKIDLPNNVWFDQSDSVSHRTTGCFDDRLLTMMTDTTF